MTTEVSSKPAPRRSCTGRDVLVEDSIHVGSEAIRIDFGSPSEHFDHGLGIDGSRATKRSQLTYRLGVPRKDEGTSFV